jgi:CheY-like chemotaxis protein
MSCRPGAEATVQDVIRPETNVPRVLIVEDNQENRDMLARRLQRKGYDTLIAVDGQAGVDSALRDRPDLVLMDMSLPVIDGWEATRRIKADATGARIPIIALTAHAMAGDRARAVQAGCDDYDPKPVDLPRLLAKMQALLPGEERPVPTGE